MDLASSATQFVADIAEAGALETPSAPVQPEQRTFGLPFTVWAVMFVSYGVFFTGLALATGRDGNALFMIAISLLYTTMYFGTATALNGAGPRAGRSQWIAGKLQTFTGPMSISAVCAQVLVVPMMIALFGLAIAAIRAYAL